MSAFGGKADIAPDNYTLRAAGAVQTRLRTDRSTSVSTLRMPLTWSTRLRMTIARAQLIRDLKSDLGVNDEGVGDT